MLPTVLTCFERGNTHPEEHEYPKHLHREPNQRPPHENQQHARPKRQRAFPLVPAREEHKRPLRAEEERDADEEEDVAHGEQGAVEEQDQAEDEEEAAAAAEGDADFCWKRESLLVLLYIVKEPGCLLNSLLLGRTLRVGEPHCRHGGREVWVVGRKRRRARERWRCYRLVEIFWCGQDVLGMSCRTRGLFWRLCYAEALNP